MSSSALATLPKSELAGKLSSIKGRLGELTQETKNPISPTNLFDDAMVLFGGFMAGCARAAKPTIGTISSPTAIAVTTGLLGLGSGSDSAVKFAMGSGAVAFADFGERFARSIMAPKKADNDAGESK